MTSARSPKSEVSNAHTRPMSRLFYGPVYFKTHFRALFPAKIDFHHVYERIRSIRYQKGKLNITFRSVGFANWFMEFKT